jgi:hypothetical protein
MQQIVVIGYHPPQHYYSLLSGAARPCILHHFTACPYQGDLERDLCYWMFPEDLQIYDESLTHRHTFLNHELQIRPISSPRLSQPPVHFVLTGSTGAFSYCTSHLYYVLALLTSGEGRGHLPWRRGAAQLPQLLHPKGYRHCVELAPLSNPRQSHRNFPCHAE